MSISDIIILFYLILKTIFVIKPSNPDKNWFVFKIVDGYDVDQLINVCKMWLFYGFICLIYYTFSWITTNFVLDILKLLAFFYLVYHQETFNDELIYLVQKVT